MKQTFCTQLQSTKPIKPASKRDNTSLLGIKHFREKSKGYQKHQYLLSGKLPYLGGKASFSTHKPSEG